MTRLEILCMLHNQTGGTIFQFNMKYGVDFLDLSDGQFWHYIGVLFGDRKERAVVLEEALRDILNGLYALRDHARDEYGPKFGEIEQRLINVGIKALKK